MKRLHISVGVTDLDRSITFYSRLFGAPPGKRRDDYARWMLEDPRVNFSITARGREPGVDHVGIQAESDGEFAELRAHLAAAEVAVLDQPDATCCYARSSKAWVEDPDGLAWETFLTRGDSTEYGDGSMRADAPSPTRAAAACCGPADEAAAACCSPSA